MIFYTSAKYVFFSSNEIEGCRERMVVGFTTTCAVSAYHH